MIEDIAYVGEHLLPGQIGTAFILLAVATSLMSAFGYFRSEKLGEESWLGFGRTTFRLHTVAMLGVIGTLFYIIIGKHYEYYYVTEHMNNTMPWQFILSCFWEGQEGSFLLWTFWNVVLGNVLIRISGKWEGPVVGTFAAVQVFLTTMMVGVYFGEFQFGQNPFALIRELPANISSPMFLDPEYLFNFDKFADGKGLNPLLQNYWNTIHPPTLFLGFASTLVPFAYAIGGLVRKDFKGWMAPAIPWSFFVIMILGAGILMGGAWAYEALGFGGFWAWDPVENSSLVPWITMVGGAHLMLINKRKQTSLFTTFILVLSTFLLVLYSTFLTRSGVLGDSSVHSFVETGILPQLYFYYLFFIFASVYLLLQSRKHRLGYFITGALTLLLVLIFREKLSMSVTTFFLVATAVWAVVAYIKFERTEEEEDLWSREFWMFIGSLVLVISAVHISLRNSIPVWNLVFGEMGIDAHFAEPENIADAYHKVQIPIAILLCILIAITHYFRYTKTDMRKFVRNMVWPFALALLGSAAFIHFTEFSYKANPLVVVLLAASIFVIAASVDYAVRILKGKLNFSGANIAHVGFGMILLGAVVSTSQQEFISSNDIGDLSQLSDNFSNAENKAMYEGDTLGMRDYFVVYKDKRWQPDSVHFEVDVEYYDRAPRTYEQGDLVFKKGALFICVQDHTPSAEFLDDMEPYWSEVPFPNSRQLKVAQPWENGKPGAYLFTLYPSLIRNDRMGSTSREPSIKHYWGKDIYTYLNYVDTEDPVIDERGYHEERKHVLMVGQSISISGHIVEVDSVNLITDGRPEILQNEDTYNVFFTVSRKDRAQPFNLPFISLRGQVIAEDYFLDDWGFKFRLENFDPQRREVTLQVAEHDSVAKDFIVMTAVVFPQINILWIGCLVMVIGTVIAILHRIREFRRRNTRDAG